jgi:hypothetical protein
VYKTLNTIASRKEDMAGQGGVGLLIDFAAKSLAVTDGSKTCTDAGIAPLAFAPATCPTGTSSELNPQDTPTLDVFAAKQCAPCDTGYQCASGVATACSAGTENGLVGALSADACTGCSDFTVSAKGERSKGWLRPGLPGNCFDCVHRLAFVAATPC